MRLIVTLGILLSLCCLVHAADTGPTYPIVFDRHNTVGEKFRIVSTGSDQSAMKVSSGKDELQNETGTFNMRLEATVQVLEVNQKSDAIKESITIEKCVKVDGTQEVTLAEKGTVVIAAIVNNNDVYTINGETVSEDLETALGMAINLSNDETSQDEFAGTRQPQPVGASWDMDADKAVKTLTRNNNITVSAKDFSGKSTLKEATTVDGQQCIRVVTQMQMKNLKPASLPPEMTIKRSDCTLSLSGLLPVDAAKGPIEEQQDMMASFLLTGKPIPDSPMVTVEAMTKRTVVTKYSPVQ